MIITTLSKQPMRYDVVDIQLVKHRVRILEIDETEAVSNEIIPLTLLKLAVNTTIS